MNQEITKPANIQRPKGLVYTIAQIISDVFSPLLIPLYTMALSMWVTPLQGLPERPRFLATLVVFIITGVLPFMLMWTLLRMGKLSNMAATDRKQRILPFGAALISYIATAVYLGNIHCPVWVIGFFIGATVAVFIDLLITLRWQISAHATAIGGFVGYSLWLTLKMLLMFDPAIWLTLVFVLSGIIGTSRLLLGRHTAGQVFAGWGVGFVCVFFYLYIFIA